MPYLTLHQSNELSCCTVMLTLTLLFSGACGTESSKCWEHSGSCMQVCHTALKKIKETEREGQQSSLPIPQWIQLSRCILELKNSHNRKKDKSGHILWMCTYIIFKNFCFLKILCLIYSFQFREITFWIQSEISNNENFTEGNPWVVRDGTKL